ncbi:Signaling protein RIC-8/synembryn (regulates neurotransmitter secretion) [Ceraceosorus bombacis]|uniref:Signaling protein RIC-8/synembryn (Regulates neurotransmitter secretion) n=1 Tax=Ceraceosorus bombacis TaxID=401625 RepID=A0A0P1BHN7_9BASI|nr:Signaling protein RIC-8/synembryn (regulates neurotransmitter secretion) [Ceraceosorus bombacis]
MHTRVTLDCIKLDDMAAHLISFLERSPPRLGHHEPMNPGRSDAASTCTSGSVARESSSSATLNAATRDLAAFLEAAPSGASQLPGPVQRKTARAILEELAHSPVTSVEGDDSCDAGRERSGENGKGPGLDEHAKLIALRTLKEIGRLSAGGSAEIAKPESLRTLLACVHRPPPSLEGYKDSGAPISSALKRVIGRVTPSSRQRTSSSSSNKSQASLGLVPDSRSREARQRSASPSSHDERSLEMRDCISIEQWRTTDMALRCINNALYLHEDMRSRFGSPQIGGGRIALQMLQNPSVTPAEILFLSGRLLFYATLFDAEFCKAAVETFDAPGILSELLQHVAFHLGQAIPETLAAELAVPGSEEALRNAASEALKAAFNLTLYYPRQAKAGHGTSPPKDKAVIGEAWSPALEGLIEPTIQLLLSATDPLSLPLAPPLTNAIAVLLNCPVGANRAAWYSVRRNSRDSGRSDDEQVSQPASPSTARRVANVLFPKSSSTASPRFGGSSTPSSPLSQHLSLSGPDTASTTGEMGTTISSTGVALAPSILAVLVNMLEGALLRYFPAVDDSDDSQAKHAAARDGVDLEDHHQPLILLLRKLATEDQRCRAALRARLLPSDIDRSSPLDKRNDLTGRCVRLMSSVFLSRLARVMGEMLLAVCDGNPKVMTAEIGYGPCAGFLMSANLAYALPTESRSDASTAKNGPKRTINPITGQYDPTPAELADDEISKMSDEQKEIEAEKLFTLFDRLDKTGVVKAQSHPLRAAQESGRFEEITREIEERERQREEDEEAQIEKDVERDMRAFRERRQPRT